MGMNQDALLIVRAQLCERIDQIAAQVGQIASGRLAAEIDEIRRQARDYGLPVVANLAHGLESALARSEGSITVLPYLELMRDALGCDPMDDQASQTFLAMVNQRFGG